MIEPVDGLCFQSDPRELRARVHAGCPVWTRLELAKGAQGSFWMLRIPAGVHRLLPNLRPITDHIGHEEGCFYPGISGGVHNPGVVRGVPDVSARRQGQPLIATGRAFFPVAEVRDNSVNGSRSSALGLALRSHRSAYRALDVRKPPQSLAFLATPSPAASPSRPCVVREPPSPYGQS